MNSGQTPAKNHALSRRFLAGSTAEKVEFLNVRLERLIKGLRHFAGYCDFAPDDLRSEVKQYVDLAEIELREGLKALHHGRHELSRPDALPEEATLTTNNQQPPVASNENLVTQTTSDLVDTSSDPLLSNPSSNINSLGVSFDSMAKMAEVPVANDLEAILARLQSYSDALNNDEVEGQNVGTQPGRDARERLLGFEVCRMDELQAETPTGPATDGQPSAQAGDLSNNHSLASSNNATSFTTQYTEIVEFNSESLAVDGVVSHSLGEDDAASVANDTCATDSTKGIQTVGVAQEETVSLQTPSEAGAREHKSPNMSQDLKNHHSENSSPLNSISPDNLREINSLKEELNSMLSQFKSSDAVPGSS